MGHAVSPRSDRDRVLPHPPTGGAELREARVLWAEPLTRHPIPSALRSNRGGGGESRRWRGPCAPRWRCPPASPGLISALPVGRLPAACPPPPTWTHPTRKEAGKKGGGFAPSDEDTKERPQKPPENSDTGDCRRGKKTEAN